MLRSKALNADVMERPDWDPRDVALLLRDRNPGSFSSEEDVVEQIRAALDRLQKPKGLFSHGLADAPFATYLADLEAKRRQAHDAFEAGRFSEALRLHEDLARRTSELSEGRSTPDINDAKWRSVLNCAICRLALSDFEVARELLLSIAPESLMDDSRLALARALVNIRELDRGKVVTDTLRPEQAAPIRELIGIAEGRVPVERPIARDNVIYSIPLLVREERFHTACEWLAAVLQDANGPVLYELAALEALMILLEGWAWAQDLSDALSTDDALYVCERMEHLLQRLKAKTLEPALLRRMLEIELGMALRSYDDDRQDAVRAALLEAGGQASLPDAGFTDALALARAGDIDSAMLKLADDQHSWRSRLRAVAVFEGLGDLASARDSATRLVGDYPDRLLTEYEAARQLTYENQWREVLPHSERAFQAWPGYGQRLLHALALLRCDRHQASIEMIRPIRETSSRALAIYAEALEPTDLLGAIQAWQAYCERKDDLQIKVRLTALEFKAGLTTDAAQRGWALVHGREAKQLDASTLHQLALCQALGLPPAVAHERVTEIAKLIKERAASAKDEELYFGLWSWLRTPSQLPPPDLKRLTETGAVEVLSEPDLVSFLGKAANEASTIETAYRFGHISYEALADELHLNSARFVASLGVDIHLPAIRLPDADDEPAPTDVVSLLVSEIELLFCAKLSILDRLDSVLPTGGQLLLFEDVRGRFFQSLVLLRLEVPERRVEEAARAMAAMGNPSLVSVHKLVGPDVVGKTIQSGPLVRWMQAVGVISRSRAQSLTSADDQPAWKPTGPLAVTAAAMRWLLANDLLAALVEAQHAPVAIEQAEAGALRADYEAAGLDLTALRLCEEVHHWLETKAKAGRLRVIPRPDIEGLPVAKGPGVENVRRWILKALSWRVAAQQHNAHSLSLDAAVRYLFSGLYLPRMLFAVAWDADSYATLKATFRDDGRVLGMDWFADRLELDANQRHRIAAAGSVDVLAPKHFADLLDEYSAESPKLADLFRVIELPLHAPHHAHGLSTDIAISKPYGALVSELLGRSREAAGSFIANVLRRWDAYAPSRVAPLLAFVLRGAFERCWAAYIDFTTSSESAIGRLFTELATWARGNERRTAVLGRASADIVVSLDKAAQGSPPKVALGVLHLLAEVNPERTGADLMSDLASALAIISGVWDFTPLSTLGITLTRARGHERIDRPLEDLVASGVRRLGDRPGLALSPLVASWREPVFDSELQVRVPVEAIVLRAAPTVAVEIARELAPLQGPDDGRLYELLLDLARAPEDVETRHRLARRAIQSPWKQVLRDLCSIQHWGDTSALFLGAPVSLDELQGFLSEPRDKGGATTDTGVDRLASYLSGPWKDRLDQYKLFEQAGCVPGTAGVQVALALEANEELDSAVMTLALSGSANFGELWVALVALWQAATKDQLVTVDGVQRPARIELQTRVTEVLRAAVADPERGRLEAQLLRLCRTIVSRFASERGDLVWLTYRLFGWLWRQLRSADPAVVRADLERLAAIDTASLYNERTGDPMDPLAWPAPPDLRIVAITNTIALGGLPVDGFERWHMPICDELRSLLVQIASQEPDESERVLEAFPRSQWQWIGTPVPRQSALFVLLQDGGAFLHLPEAARLRWIQELPMGDDAAKGIDHENLIGRLLVSSASAMEGLGAMERTALTQRLLESRSPSLTTGLGQAVALVALLGKKLVDADVVWPRIRDVVATDGYGAVLLRLYANGLVDSDESRLRDHLTEALDHVRGGSSADVVERLSTDPIFQDERKLLDTVRTRLQEPPP